MPYRLQFSVIYSVDCTRDTNILPHTPSWGRWDTTEDDDQYEYDYLEGDWEGGQHRKFCAVLSREYFEKFLAEQELKAEDVETMGSLGAPGLGFGCSPAISFNGGEDGVMKNAYVTPFPELDPDLAKRPELSEDDWKRIKRAVLTLWG